ncbi:hypothetical protein F5Y12DRAFT_529579 [Xylaria sp. FL1777]|nr:hypothetical protein F5Y12DRAFT_529579 [Xylaria sp. FL1777]
MASLPPSEIQYQEAHLSENESPAIIAVSTIFAAVALITFLLRVAARYVTAAHFGLDDGFALASVISLIVLSVATSLSAHYGIGRHLIAVLKEDPNALVTIGKTELALSVSYGTSLCMGKLAILALFTRIFTFINRRFKTMVLILSVVVLCWYTATILVIFLECRPLTTVWGDPYQCFPSQTTTIVLAVINIVIDVAILALPQPLIWKLNCGLRKKLQISAVLLVGVFSTIISIIRIPYQVGSLGGSPYDTTYSLYPGYFFIIIEPATLVLCGSLPMIPGLIQQFQSPHPPNSRATKGSSRGYLRSTGSADQIELAASRTNSAQDKASISNSATEIQMHIE